MVRRCLGLCLVLMSGGCTTNAENAPAVPDAAGASAESTARPDSEATDSGAADSDAADAAKPDSAQGDTSSDGSALSDDTTTSTSTSAPLSSDDATNAAHDAGDGSKVTCDVRNVTCKRAEPTCDYGYVPRIIDGCYAECVRIDDCVCNGADACPQHERYTCNNSRQRCTPYLI